MTPRSTTLYTSCTVFTAHETGWAEAFVVQGDRLAWVGDEATARRLAGSATTEVNLGGRMVMPGFIDAHTHLLMMGQSLQKVDLMDAVDVADIQERLRAARAANPGAKRLFGRSWLFNVIPNGTPTRAMLDEAVSDIPVYLDANDLHSIWLNSAALAELGVSRDTPDPIGGTISRNSDGEPDGMLYEMAALGIAWAGLAALTSDEERDVAIDATFAAYTEAGVTGAIDMAMDADAVAAMERAIVRHGGRLPLRVVGHWRVSLFDDRALGLAEVEHAAELARTIAGPWFRLAGIKLMVDGVIDACTAAMVDPFHDGSRPDPIWDLDSLIDVITAADAAGLQIAVHAIGDLASDNALTAFEQAQIVNGPRPRRHRIEHLETVLAENVTRLAQLGVVASMQPVHADPAVQENWRAMLGDGRVDRGFPWPEMTDAGARVAFGTDAPTAPHEALPNMFIAATRRSALVPSLLANVPSMKVSLEDALWHATIDAAYSCGDELNRGSLATGMLADFIVLDTNPFEQGEESLLGAQVMLTVVGGQTVFERS
ncbi:amidohydrolase [Leifsonia sp. YAF41]|uniref:amidohydrolase n=1 Tax=Leifsonia sp. YAF41 TaxID=3233086 RepID=UPI003F982B37